ncbi:Ig-like domain-containing protein [Kitasatospora sp. NPDC058965]|uniref:L,D-transpeptidase family protein n=1 Tax=Kitasatospora sp. NPDC058965 TaxID=3346682 RepID=UPI0036BDC73A
MTPQQERAVVDGPSGGSWSRRGMLTGLLGAPVLLLAACGGADGRGGQGKGGPAAGGGGAPRSSAAVITVTPADGTTGAAFTAPVTVSVAAGTLDSVRVTDPTGREIPGRLAPDGASWTTTAPLASATRYTVAAVAADKDRITADASSAFTTATPAKTFTATFTPEDGSTVGVGMPVSITFSTPVTDRRAVQQAITVVAEPGVEVVGHWYSSTRLDFRPAQYWAKGTRVTLRLRLKDVQGAPGVFGTQSKDVAFTIGRSQTSLADLSAGTLTVTTDGRVSAVYPVIGGGPDHRTWGGRMVISEQFTQTRMNSATVNLGDEYDIPDVPHAQRLTASGTFVHGNYWSPRTAFGHANLSHGCIALRDVQGAGDPTTDAARFYASSLPGDVVEVVNSGDRTVDAANGLGDWNLTWADWTAGSAI